MGRRPKRGITISPFGTKGDFANCRSSIKSLSVNNIPPFVKLIMSHNFLLDTGVGIVLI